MLFILNGWAGAEDGPSIALHLSIVDQDNKPIAQALTEVRTGDQLLTSAPTTDAGKANLNIPHPGNYILKISKKGYVPTETTLEFTSQAEQAVDVVLQRA